MSSILRSNPPAGTHLQTLLHEAVVVQALGMDMAVGVGPVVALH
jgi:hypothetical protein